MSGVDWTLYADGVCESLNRATTVEHAARVAADGMAYELDYDHWNLYTAAERLEMAKRRVAARRIAAVYRATITRLTEDGPR